MLISLNWLKQYVDIKESIEELENTLTMIGQEVEAVNIQGENLDNVVIGKIVKYGKHPNSDTLTLLNVNVGGNKDIQIVCGAKNHKLGDKVVVAMVGANLPGNFKIKNSKIRDVESNGMLCSEVELGIGTDNSGIIILPEDAPVGEEFRKYKNLNDIIFELEITPNRPDCLCHVGIAREVAAYYDRKIRINKFKSNKALENIYSTNFKLNVDDKERCKRFSLKIIRNVKVKESPEWLKEKIMAMGLKPINNIVDATNYMLFESNQPFHAYDLSKISGGEINVRAASKNEVVVTLDGEKRKLTQGELVIADSEKILGIAGIMGGESSKVTEDTTTILLECAYFTPENIRKTSKKLGVSSDSSYRFERGIDLENGALLLERAADLISELSDGEVLDGVQEKIIEKEEKLEISLNINKMKKFMGKNISIDEVCAILANLEIKIKTLDLETIIATPPSFRKDLTRTADLYEEVIRMYGFENIESQPIKADIKSGIKDEIIEQTDYCKELLVKVGLQEVINYSFIPKTAIELLNIKKSVLEIKNPISDDMAVMRPTLIYSLLANVRDNFNRNQNGVKFFEVSKVFSPKKDGLAEEELKVGIAIAGKPYKTLWEPKPEKFDFYDLKGIVENFLNSLGIEKYKFERLSDKNFHPGRSAEIKIGNVKLGIIGEIHPSLAEKMDIKKERVYVVELDVASLMKHREEKIEYKKIVKYPEVTRDLAIVLDKDVFVGKMVEELKKLSPIIENISIFDVYEGEKIESDKKSVAISIVLRKQDGTLAEDDINEIMKKIVNLLSKKWGGFIRQ